MPTLADFLARALPWPAPGEPGVVNLHWRSWKGRGVTGGRPFTTLEDLLSFIGWTQGQGGAFVRELYYCTSLQKDVGPPHQGSTTPTALRSGENTLCSKAFFADIDKGYPTPGAALAAVNDMCRATNSPEPTAIVVSGNGLHLYWLSTVAFKPDEWKRYAVALDSLLTTHGVHHDAVTTDITRILRPPGTFNNKGRDANPPTDPKPVVLKFLAPDDIDFANWEALHSIRPPETTSLGVAPRVTLSPADIFVNPEDANVAPSKLITDSLKPEDWIDRTIDPTPVFQCPMFKHTLETHGADVGQPLWNQQALACTFLRDGEALFHNLSSGHSTYTPADTDTMFARKVRERVEHNFGYPSCSTFEREGSAQCSGCPFKNVITSPLSLKWPKSDKTKLIETTQDNNSGLIDAAAPVAEDPNGIGPLLYGFTWSKTRAGAIDILIPQAKGPPVQRPCIYSVLSNFSCTKNRSGEFELNFKTTTDYLNFTEVTIKNSVMHSPGEIAKVFSKFGVGYLPSASARIADLMNSFMERIKQFNKAMVGIPYGWIMKKEQGKTSEISGFAYGGHVYNTDGTIERTAVGDRVTSLIYTPVGDEQSWFTALDTLLLQGRIPLQTIALTGFAAPLMKLTGFHGVSVMAWGDSGGNKSTASDLACGVWGSPKGVKETPSTSQMSFQGKMAETRHLLNCWDDIRKPQYERIGKLLMEITHGKGGGKMTNTHDQKDMGEWDSILLTTSNDSLADYVVQANKNDAAALYRCFEFKVNKVADDTPGRANPGDIEPIYTALDDNFGYIGRRYARMLGHKIVEVREILKEAKRDVETSIGGRRIPDDERFWVAAAECLVAASVLANAVIMTARRELNMPPGLLFDTQGVLEHVLEAYRKMRNRVIESGLVSSSDDYIGRHLGAYLNDRIHNAVWTDTVADATNLIYPPAETMRHMKRVTARWYITEQKLVISRGDLTEYFLERDVSPELVVNGLKSLYAATAARRRIAAGVVGTSSVQEYLLEIPITKGSWLHATLMEHSTRPDQSADDQKISHTV